MNAAWGMMLERDIIVLNLTESHKTVKNIKERKSFTVSIADANHVKEADYFGVVSANTMKDKFAKSGLTATKSDFIDAPIINEFPICMECEFIEYQDNEYGCGVVGKICNVTADESILKDANGPSYIVVSAVNCTTHKKAVKASYVFEKSIFSGRYEIYRPEEFVWEVIANEEELLLLCRDQ